MKPLFVLSMLITAYSMADNISIQCGKTDKKGNHEIEYGSDGIEPEDRSDWGLYNKGKERKQANTVTLIQKKDSPIVTGLIVTDKKPKKKVAYNQYIFTGVDKCPGGGVEVQVYKVGTASGKKEAVGDKLRCDCD